MGGDTQSQSFEYQPVIERILDSVAEAEDTDPIDFDRPLYDVLDPGALDSLVQSADAGVHVEFTYYGYTVTVCPDGEITLCQPDA